MARLSISLLGAFQIVLDGRPVTDFKSNKVRALLAYLAVEADRPHRRETLAGLLWPEWPNRDALSNLRYALSDLRGTIGDREADPPFLLISRDTLQLNPEGDHWVDVTAFLERVSTSGAGGTATEHLEEAVEIYRGPFMAGFSLADCPGFEEWALFTKEQLSQQMAATLHTLSVTYEERGDYEQAQAYAWRLLELEPWDERGHQQLMRALALMGRRSAALNQYETCRRVLGKELGVEPSAETTALYRQIRDGRLRVTEPPSYCPAPPNWGADVVAGLPAFFDEEPQQADVPVFVARQRELAWLDGMLEQTLAGNGRVVFVTGEAGSGKTALIQAWARQAQKAHADLVVAGGSGSAYTGIGDPYLPFRQILELLTGDVEARWAAGAITRERARRLWTALPLAVHALVEHGPDLIDTFVPRQGLRRRAQACAAGSLDWLAHLDEVLQQKPSRSEAPNLQQAAVFEQYADVLQAVALRIPLVLVIDDLQWADAGSISLLFHLGRQAAGGRLLIIGAYRPEDVAVGQDGNRHPLEAVVNELRRDFGDIVLNLDQAEGSAFVEALLDSEPNRLSDEFRDMLARQTSGHPLFTVELLRGLQDRGDLRQDAEGRWVARATLDWETLPARVEAVIRERIDRLAQPLRAALHVASVEGEQFTAEVVARVQGVDEKALRHRLSESLERTHKLVAADSIARVGDRLLSRYRFRHILFQRYLYSSLDEVERVSLHDQVGRALEDLYQAESGAPAIAPQLARHFEQAQKIDKAVDYLHQAGERAVRLGAYREGVAHLKRGLDLLVTLPDASERIEREITLQLSLGMAWMDTAAPERERAYRRAIELDRGAAQPSPSSRSLAVGGLATLRYVQADHHKALELAREALRLAEKAEDSPLIALGHWYLGFISFALGDCVTAREHLQRMLTSYGPEDDHTFISLRTPGPGLSALAYDACCLWTLGYPDQALARREEVLQLARDLGHTFYLADVLCFGGCLLDQMRRDGTALELHAEELIQVSGKIGYASWIGSGTFHRGAAWAMQGRPDDGIAEMRAGLAARGARGMRCQTPEMLRALAEAQAKAGRLAKALATVNEGLATMEETGEHQWEADLHRMKGVLLHKQGKLAEAEASFQTAIDVARRQHAKMWELRATVALSRLWQQQGKRAEARRLLGEIYGWFTEGFDTPDLLAAKSLLDELA